MRQAAIVLLFFASSAACAQPDSAASQIIPDVAAPPPYSVVIRDGDAYWDSTLYAGSLKVKDLAVPDSNFVPCAEPMPEPLAQALDSEVAAELARLNEFDPYGDGWQEDRYAVVERRCYTAGNATVGLLRVRTTGEEWEGLAIGVWGEGEEPRLFAESNSLDEEGYLIAYAEEDGVPVVYGHRRGNPNLSFGGRFRLEFRPSERVLSFEYYERNG